MKVQNVGGADLPYLYYEGAAPPILFVHATGFLPWLWHPIIEMIDPHPEAWAPYICNYRDGDPEKKGIPWDVIARDLVSFCSAQGVKDPLVVGHSMGATVLTIASGLFGFRPRGMILIEPIFLPEEFYDMDISLRDHPLASRAVKRKSRWQDEKTALAYLKSKALFAGWDEQMLQFYMKYGMMKHQEGGLTLTCAPRTEAALFMGGHSTNPWPLLRRLTCPVLIVEGEKSANQEFIDLTKAVALVTEGQYHKVSGAGHLIPMEKPAETARIIQAFLKNIL